MMRGPIAIASAYLLLGLLILLFAASTSAQSSARRTAAAVTAVASAKEDKPSLSGSASIALPFANLDARKNCDSSGAPAGSAPAYPNAERIYVTVKNEGTVDFTLDKLVLLAPSDLQLCDGSPDAATSSFDTLRLARPIASGRSEVIGLRIGLRSRSLTGTLPLIIRADVSSTIGTQAYLASDKVETRVPGVSDTLKLFGAPTVLLLPGILVLGAMSLVFTPKNAALASATSAGFWIVSIMSSLVIATLYLKFYNLGAATLEDLIDRYEIADIVCLWVISIILGLMFGGIGLVVQWVLKALAAKRADKARAAADRAAEEAEQRKREEIAELKITSNDDPRRLVERLVLLNLSVPTNWVKVGNRSGFLVESDEPPQKWLVPQAEIDPDPAPSRAVLQKLAGVGKEAMSARELQGMLSEDDLKHLELRWVDGRPASLQNNQTAEVNGDMRFFRID